MKKEDLRLFLKRFLMELKAKIGELKEESLQLRIKDNVDPVGPLQLLQLWSSISSSLLSSF